MDRIANATRKKRKMIKIVGDDIKIEPIGEGKAFETDFNSPDAWSRRAIKGRPLRYAHHYSVQVTVNNQPRSIRLIIPSRLGQRRNRRLLERAKRVLSNQPEAILNDIDEIVLNPYSKLDEWGFPSVDADSFDMRTNNRGLLIKRDKNGAGFGVWVLVIPIRQMMGNASSSFFL